MGKFTYQASAIGLLAAYTIDSARNIITINVRDGAARIIIEFSEVHAMGRGINTWRSANKGEFESVKFPEACKKISNDFEKYVIDGSIAVTKKFEQTDRQNELNLILAHYKENAIKIDSPIIILQGDTSYPDSAGGVSCFVFFQNISSKRIKYVYVTVTPYNRVDDIAYSEIGGESTTVLKYTGYLEPNEWNLFGWGDVWYNATISYIKINKIEIIMEDNSKIILDDEKDINYIMLNEEEGNRWQSSRK
jgi:hypothetical protein